MSKTGLTRRAFLKGASAIAVAMAAGIAQNNAAFAAEQLPMYFVRYTGQAPADSLHISNERGYMYRILGGQAAGYAIAYPIAIGQEGLAIPPGTELKIVRLDTNPTWTPPPEMKVRNPSLRNVGTVPGGPGNPLGEYSMVLARANGEATAWRIHMSPTGDTIGYAISNGCIHMYKSQIQHFFNGVTFANGLSLQPLTHETPVTVYKNEVPGIEDKGPKRSAQLTGLAPK